MTKDGKEKYFIQNVFRIFVILCDEGYFKKYIVCGLQAIKLVIETFILQQKIYSLFQHPCTASVNRWSSSLSKLGCDEMYICWM